VTLKPGDTITVDFKGRDHQAEVIEQRSGYVMCRIHIDPTWDYGSATWLDPEPTICVRDTNVRTTE
jgi:hypothetical protein